MLSVDDLAFISTELMDENNDEDDGNMYESDDGNDAFVVQDKNDSACTTEKALANKAFIHGTTFNKNLDKEYLEMEAALTLKEIPEFKGIRIEKCCNKSSVMAYSQYKAYSVSYTHLTLPTIRLV